MKRLIAFTLLLSLLLLLPACAATDQTVSDVDALKKQIIADYKAKYDRINAPYNLRYYTSDNGYHIISWGGMLCDLTSVKIAGYSFSCSSDFKLMAYKNGKFIKLKTAYLFGRVSKDAIARTYEVGGWARVEPEPSSPTEPLTPKEAYIRQYGPVDIFREYTTVYEYGNAISIIYAVQQDAPASESVRTIAGFEFKFQREGSLCVYKHGVFTDLEEAYNKKLIAKEHIERVAKTHARFESKTK